MGCWLKEYWPKQTPGDTRRAILSGSIREQEAQLESKRKERELTEMIARCHELDGLFTKTYEDNTSGKLSDERFMMITKRYDDEQVSLKRKSPLCKQRLMRKSDIRTARLIFCGQCESTQKIPPAEPADDYSLYIILHNIQF